MKPANQPLNDGVEPLFTQNLRLSITKEQVNLHNEHNKTDLKPMETKVHY